MVDNQNNMLDQNPEEEVTPEVFQEPTPEVVQEPGVESEVEVTTGSTEEVPVVVPPSAEDPDAPPAAETVAEETPVIGEPEEVVPSPVDPFATQVKQDKLDGLEIRKEAYDVQRLFSGLDDDEEAEYSQIENELDGLRVDLSEGGGILPDMTPEEMVSKSLEFGSEVIDAVVGGKAMGAGLWRAGEGLGELVNIPKEAIYDPIVGGLIAQGVIARDYQLERIDIPGPESVMELSPIENGVADLTSFMALASFPLGRVGSLIPGATRTVTAARQLTQFTSKFATQVPGYGKAALATEAGKKLAVRMAGSQRIIKDFVKAEFLSTIPDDATESEIVERLISGAKGGGVAVVFGPAFQGIFKGLEATGKYVIKPTYGATKTSASFINERMLKPYAINIKANRMLDRGLRAIPPQLSAEEGRIATMKVIEQVNAYLDGQTTKLLGEWSKGYRVIRDDARKAFNESLEPTVKETTEKVGEAVTEKVVAEEVVEEVVVAPLTAAERKAAAADGKAAAEELSAKIGEAEASAAEGEAVDFIELAKGFSLPRVFKNKKATLTVARGLGIKVTEEGSRKYLPYPVLQEKIAAKLGQPIPPGFGLKPSTTPGRSANVSRITQDKEVQDMLINPKLLEGLDEEARETVLKILNKKEVGMTLEQMEVEGLAIAKEFGLTRDPAALIEFATNVDRNLLPQLKALRALRFAQGRHWNAHYTKMIKAQESGDPKLLLEVAQDLVRLSKTQAILETNMGHVGAELGAFRIIADGTRPSIPLDPRFSATEEAFNGFLRRMYGNKISIQEAGKRWATAQLGVMEEAVTRQTQAQYMASAAGLGTLGLKTFKNYFINNMLNAPATFSVNAASPQFMGIWYTAEDAFGRMTQGEFRKAYHSVRYMFSTPGDIWYALRSAMKGFKSNRNPVDPRGKLQTDDYTNVHNSVIAATYGRPAEGAMERFIDHLYNITGAPSRFLNATDTFNKAKAYKQKLRVELKSDAAVKAADPLETRTANEIFNESWKKTTELEARYTKESVTAEAAERAAATGFEKGTPEYVEVFEKTVEELWDVTLANAAEKGWSRALDSSFTRPLTEEGRTPLVKATGEFFQGKLANHWAIGTAIDLNIPFKGVPTNMAAFWLDRQIPFASAQSRGVISNELRRGWQKIKDRMTGSYASTPKTAAEKEAAAAFYARAGAGVALTKWAYGLAVEGRITGSGPEDPKARRMLERTGWRQYSFKVHTGNRQEPDPENPEEMIPVPTYDYVSYLRADPFAAWMSTMADAAETYKFSTGKDFGEANLLDIMAVGSVSMHESLDDRTMARGIQNLGIMFNSDDSNQKEVAINNIVGTLTPGGSFGKRLTTVFDEYRRDTNSSMGIFRRFVDIAKSRTPGQSRNVAPLYDPFGKVVKVEEYWEGPSFFKPAIIGKMSSMLKWSKYINDPVAREINRQWEDHWGEESGFPITVASSVLNVKGVDLHLEEFEWDAGGRTWNMYSKLQHLSGNLTVGGLNQYDTIKAFIKTDAYKALPDFDPDVKIGTNKIKEIVKIQNKFRNLAKNHMIGEFRRSSDPKEQILGLYFSLSMNKAIEHIKKNPKMAGEYEKALEALMEDKDQAAIEAGKLMIKAGVFK